MLDIFEGLKTTTGIPMIVRLVKPLEGYGRPVETADGFEFSCENDLDTFLLEFYDARYPEVYRNVGIRGAFVARYDLRVFSPFDYSEEYMDIEASDDYRFSSDCFREIVEWAEKNKPLMVGRTDHTAKLNVCSSPMNLSDHYMPDVEDYGDSDGSNSDDEDDCYPLPETNGNVSTLKFTDKAQSVRDFSSLGRNGWMKTIGVQVIDSEAGFVSLVPINSREQSGRCEIQIPKDRGHLEAIIDMYQAILEDVKENA